MQLRVLICSQLNGPQQDQHSRNLKVILNVCYRGSLCRREIVLLSQLLFQCGQQTLKELLTQFGDGLLARTLFGLGELALRLVIKSLDERMSAGPGLELVKVQMRCDVVPSRVRVQTLLNSFVYLAQVEQLRCEPSDYLVTPDAQFRFG